MKSRTLYFGDNLEILREKIPDESFDLIYLDPPFNSNRNYNVLFKEGLQESPAQIQAFEDSWHWTREAQETFEELVGVRESETKVNEEVVNLMQALEKLVGHNDVLAYLTMMTIRLIELKRVLKNTGSIYLHCDPTASHYLKIVMDAIFGKENFQNEVIWHYRRWTGTANKFLSMHDVLLFYTKKPRGYTFNRLFTAYTEKSLKRKQHYHTRIKGDDVYVTSIDEKGVRENDVWEIPVINSQAKERLGYPTQKPEALLERIIQASSNEGDFVFDPFCGCGTTVAVAERLNRKWVGIDISMLAINLIRHRLTKQFPDKLMKLHIEGRPKDLTGANALFKKDPFEFEYWALDLVSAVPSQSKTKENMHGADKGIDGVINFIKDVKSKDKYEYGKIIVQVKGGKVQRSDIATLKGDIDREKATGGLLITLEKPTKPMREETVSAGSYKVKLGSEMEFPKVQILTVEDLLNNKKPKVPLVALPYYKEAKANEVESKKGVLGI